MDTKTKFSLLSYAIACKYCTQLPSARFVPRSESHCLVVMDGEERLFDVYPDHNDCFQMFDSETQSGVTEYHIEQMPLKEDDCRELVANVPCLAAIFYLTNKGILKPAIVKNWRGLKSVMLGTDNCSYVLIPMDFTSDVVSIFNVETKSTFNVVHTNAQTIQNWVEIFSHPERWYFS